MKTSFITKIRKIPFKIHVLVRRVKKYCIKLLIPLYLFPIKLITYSLYYLIKIVIKFVISVIKMIIDALIFPFKGLRNFLKTIFILLIIVYMLASLFVIVDYLHNEYGYVGKFFCSISTKDRLKASVVRVVGGYSEGTGFFIAENKVLTNFHVIADEPSPKIIFPDGSFITPVKIVGDETADLAVLITAGKYPEFVMPLSKYITLNDDEPVLASGYPMGTDLKGPATVLRGNYIEYRHSKKARTSYIQTDISLVEGMSGGPMTD